MTARPMASYSWAKSLRFARSNALSPSCAVDPAQAKVTCDGDLNVTTNAALTVRMIGCPDRTFG
jgi:hypothetical protein